MPAARFVLFAFLVLRPLCAAEIEFVTQELPWAVVDKGYAPPPLEARTSGACTSGGISYAVVSGVLPPGLQFSRLGYISGVPLRTGTYEMIVRVANGCTWTTKHFTLISTGAPVLSGTPQKLEFRWSVGQKTAPLEQVVRVSATWPRLAYRATSSADWLTLAAEHGYTPRQTSALAGDEVHVRADPTRLKPGRYPAVITVSAWQALEALRIPVELTVTESPAPSGNPTSAFPA
jgi:hypothetical protein